LLAPSASASRRRSQGARIVALDERGTALTTVALAQKLKDWPLENDVVALVIGGPDGLDPAFRQARTNASASRT
jgi:23S rRNA pseudoU1915 N3-methylase RlmH